MTRAAESFLGRGRGLTPAGDDLILGLALAASRWPALFWPSPGGAALAGGLGPRLPALAYRKTTLLSAGLIECACDGQADERLIAALDGLLTGSPGLEQCAKNLLSWGSSSGSDALAGITMALSTCAEFSPRAENAGGG